MSTAVKAAEACAKLGGWIVNQNCVVSPPPPIAAASNTDMLAASIAAQSNAIAAQANNLTIINLVLAIVAVLGIVGWGWFVKSRAEKMAREQADEWMDTYAAEQIAEILASFGLINEMSVAASEDQARALAEDRSTKE